MFGWILGVLLGVAAVAIVVYVSGTITRPKVTEKLRDNGIKNAMIEKINYCDNVVSIKDMDSDKTLEIHGDDVDYGLVEGHRIFV